MISSKTIWIQVALVLSIPLLVLYADVPVAHFVHAYTTPATYITGSWLEEIGKSHWVLTALVLVFVGTIRSKKHVARNAAIIFSSIALSGIIANIIKLIVCRSRPPLLFTDSIFSARPFAFDVDYLWNSFPSGHATTGLALALAAQYVLPRYRTLFWIVGLAIALGRILYNVHYLSDVVGGVAVAVFSTQLIVWLDAKRGNRWFS